MSNYFCVDVETAGLESTCIVLSAAITYFSLDEDFTFQELKARSLYIKFDAKEQGKELNRSVTKSTLEWWGEQTDAVKALAIKPHPNDVPASVGIKMIRDYIEEHGTKDSLMWQRGTLDSTSLESLCRTLGVDPLVNYNSWMDVRTALRCLKSSCNSRAYCSIPNFDPIVVDKHHPVDDICYDVMMLRYGV
jgi:hypothetical protein